MWGRNQASKTKNATKQIQYRGKKECLKIEEKNSGDKNSVLTVVIIIRKNMDFQRKGLLRKKLYPENKVRILSENTGMLRK